MCVVVHAAAEGSLDPELLVISFLLTFTINDRNNQKRSDVTYIVVSLPPTDTPAILEGTIMML